MLPVNNAVTVGTLLTGPGFFMEVHGLAAGALTEVVWGPSAHKGGHITAAKLVYPDLDDMAVRAAFEREAISWCQLCRHQSIVTALNIVRLPLLNDAPLVEMEYLPRGTLRDRLREYQRSGVWSDASVVFGWARQICSALHAMHDPDPSHDRPWSLVHGDLKPENILIGLDGCARVSDPGMVRVWAQLSGTDVLHFPDWESKSLPDRERRCQPFSQYSEDRGIGAIGQVAGTPPYMAPEQWMGIEAIDPATDLYAFGVIVFELFSGVKGWPHVPSRRDAIGWHNAHLAGVSRRLMDVDGAALHVGPLAHLPRPEYQQHAGQALAALDKLVNRCLAQKPEARPSLKEAIELLSEAETLVGVSSVDRGMLPETRVNAATYWGNLGMSYCSIGKVVHGVRLLQKSLDIDSDSFDYWISLGSVYLATGKSEEALRAFLIAEDQLSRHRNAYNDVILADVLCNAGRMFFNLERYPEAIIKFRASLDLIPDQADVWTHMGIAYGFWAIGAVDDTETDELIECAKKCCERALAIDPASDVARTFLTMIESGMDETTKGYYQFV